jgi:hypothetical protein
MGDKEMQAEGKMDEAKGAAHSTVGDARMRKSAPPTNSAGRTQGISAAFGRLFL